MAAAHGGHTQATAATRPVVPSARVARGPDDQLWSMYGD
jgi:hypothetical protein